MVMDVNKEYKVWLICTNMMEHSNVTSEWEMFFELYNIKNGGLHLAVPTLTNQYYMFCYILVVFGTGFTQH